MSSSQPDSVDKEALYGEHMARQRWQDKLFRTSCHKALDIPEDDMQLTNNQHGITGKHLVALGVIVLTGLLGWRLLTPSVSGQMAPPAAQEYEVRFWLDDGTEVEVEELK